MLLLKYHTTLTSTLKKADQQIRGAMVFAKRYWILNAFLYLLMVLKLKKLKQQVLTSVSEGTNSLLKSTVDGLTLTLLLQPPDMMAIVGRVDVSLGHM